MEVTRKKIVFFDGCGTLWFPEATKYTKNPFWIYTDHHTRFDPDAHLVLTPGAIETLEAVRGGGTKTVLLSTSPHPPAEANRRLERTVDHFGLGSLLDEAHATRDYHDSKGEFIVAILEQYGLRREEALMVGDRYPWDVRSAQKVGVDALLIRSDYEHDRIKTLPPEASIACLTELLGYL